MEISKEHGKLAEKIYGDVLPAEVTPYVCIVEAAGRDRNNLGFVSVNAENQGYGSSWDDWAYEIAFQALIHDRKLLVISNGEPFGANLLSVTLVKERP